MRLVLIKYNEEEIEKNDDQLNNYNRKFLNILVENINFYEVYQPS